jgi:ComF family protein
MIEAVGGNLPSMNIFKGALGVLVEALFPLHPTERWLSSTPSEKVIRSLPRSKQSSIAESFAVFSYKDERVKRLVWAIKYKKMNAAAAIAGAALERHIMRFALSESMPHVIIVPMPVSRQRRRERGFNQCELIVDRFKPSDFYTIEKNLLVRSKHTNRQTLKDKAEREETHDIFAVDEKTAVRLFEEHQNKDLLVLIIDDVVTTGATMKAALSCLRAAGFEAWGLSVAH